MNKPQEITPFKNFCLSIGVIPSAYTDAMSYYELLEWLCQFLQETVIPTVNNNSEVVTELQNYVTHYFDNLDVQEEIDTKLDKMVEDGTLTNLIKNYIDPIYQQYETNINNSISDINDTVIEQNNRINTLTNNVNTSITNQNNEISNFETSVNSQLNSFNNIIDSKNAGTPLVASSTDDMTETDHVYVNTTDGKWYYYDNDQWNIGGTYQSTVLGEKSVGYINENDIIRAQLFKVINADKILWRFYSVVNGGLANSTTVITSQAFLCPKGSIINMGEGVQGRITIYGLDKVYVSNTGAFARIQNYVVQNDCYIRISMNYSDQSQVALTDGNSTNVQFTGLIPLNSGESIVNSLTFKQYTSSYYISQQIYVNKGTKISTFDGDLKDSSNNDAGSILNFCVREGNQSKDPTVLANYQHTTYTVQNTGFIQIFIAVGGTVTSYHLDRINNAFNIVLNQYETNLGVINSYIVNNDGLDIKELSSGYIAFKLNNNIIIFNSNNRVELSWSSIKSTLSSYIYQIDGEDYIRIPATHTVNYNLNNSTVEIKAYNTGSIAVNNEEIILIANGYGQATGGILLDIYEKNQTIKGDPERLNDQLFNSSPYIKDYDWQTPTKNFNYKLNNMSNNIEKFFFFTDPHLMGDNNTLNKTRLRDWMCSLEKVYNSTPADYIVCGGDWLNSGDTQEYATFKLGYIKGFTKKLFNNYYQMLGNHDTNYQGKLNDESASNTGTLTNQTIRNLLFNKTNLYYKFNGVNSINYVLDTQIDWDTTMDSYKWYQINWLGNLLKNDDPTHSIIFMHIIWNDITSQTILPFTDYVTQLIEAFNSHTSIVLNDVSYDFTNCTGHVDYILGGHVHSDYSNTINNVLCIATTTFALNISTPTFDMIINDYNNNKAYFVRAGTGSSREFNI